MNPIDPATMQKNPDAVPKSVEDRRPCGCLNDGFFEWATANEPENGWYDDATAWAAYEQREHL